MKYKIGDKVKIRKDLVEGDLEAAIETEDKDLYVNSNMIEFAGKTAIITEIVENDYDYRIDLDEGSFFWADEMLENTEEIIVATPVGKTVLDKYKELTTFLLTELEIADDVRYKEVAHFITVLRPDLSELFI